MGGYQGVPAFIWRYNQNWDRIEVGHFSVLSELMSAFGGRLAQVGCRMKDLSATGIDPAVNKFAVFPDGEGIVSPTNSSVAGPLSTRLVCSLHDMKCH